MIGAKARKVHADITVLQSAEAVSFRPNRDYPGMYVVTVRCPFCRKLHRHGWNGPWFDAGTRVAHCDGRGPRGEYRIIGDIDHIVYEGA